MALKYSWDMQNIYRKLGKKPLNHSGGDDSMKLSYYNFIQNYMSTVSVPLPEDMLKSLKSIIKQGFAANMSDAIRQAIKFYLEEQAVNAVLKASKEPDLRGDLDELATKL